MLYLKDGTGLRGIVVARTLGESVEIQVRDGNVQVYAIDEISRITKEPVMGPEEIEPPGDGPASGDGGTPASGIVETSAPPAEPSPAPDVVRASAPEAEPTPPPGVESAPGPEAPAPGVEPGQTRGTRALAASGRKNPWLAFGLSALVPGAGQFYNGQHKKGVPQLGAALAGTER